MSSFSVSRPGRGVRRAQQHACDTSHINTATLLLGVLRNATPADRPTPDARNRFYQHVRRMRRTDKYDDVLAFLQSDGWVLPPPDQPVDD